VVGTVFYDTGTLVFHGGSTTTNFLLPSGSGFQFGTGATAGTIACQNFSFVALNLIKRSMFFTRAFNKEYNYTNNPTAISNAAQGIGLYNSDNELLAVAKTAPPVKKDFSTEKIFSIRIQY